MRGGPEEATAVQKTEKSGRIAERGYCAADIGDQKNKKDHNVHGMPAVIVCAQQWTNQQHCGAGGAHHARQQRSQSKQSRIHKPPATVYSAVSRIMKGRYSASSACTMLCAALPAPWTAANGATNSAAQNSAIFPK